MKVTVIKKFSFKYEKRVSRDNNTLDMETDQVYSPMK